jgi:four helix bundle protein
MSKNVLKDKSFAFAVEVVSISKKLMNEQKEFVLSRQLLRSGTAIGALYTEAEQAESIADFIHKMAISQKECNETIYWLDLLFTTK